MSQQIANHWRTNHLRYRGERIGNWRFKYPKLCNF